MEIDMNIENIARIERSIVKTIIQDALDFGYVVMHHNGEEATITVHPSDDREKAVSDIMDEIRQCDEEQLIFSDPKDWPGKRVGFVFLVYGNDGYDVICDHTDSEEMDQILAGANELASKYE